MSLSPCKLTNKGNFLEKNVPKWNQVNTDTPTEHVCSVLTINYY